MSIEKLAQARTDIFQRLVIELQKEKTKVNLDYCQEKLRIIDAIDKQLGPMLQTMNDKLESMILSQTHTLYAQNEQNRKKMQSIDEDARKLRSFIIIIQTNVNSYRELLSEILNRIQRLSIERQKREIS